MGENHFAAVPTALYGVVLLMAALAYWILQHADCGGRARFGARRAIGSDWKGKLSPMLYLTGIALTFWRPWAAQLLYTLGALVWLIPDRRIEAVEH